ncbi:MAG: ribonuclease H family protein [Halanaerobiales bacterium]
MQTRYSLDIYTDGACSHNKKGNWSGGYGVYVDGYPEYTTYGYDINTTNNKMELTALLKALEIIDKGNFIHQDINIYTDSAYIYNCIKQGWYIKWRKNGWETAKHKPVKNKKLWQQILSLYEKYNNINIVKVKGHSNVVGNIKADQLAVKGRDEAASKEILNDPYNALLD